MRKLQNTENICLSDLQELLTNKHKYFISEEKGHIGIPDDGEGNQDDYNELFKYYRHPGMPENVFMKETYNTDSYGYNYILISINFVKGITRQITVYEPI